MLMVNLHSAAPHFIRCIKPNSTKSKHEYEADLVKNQLRYTGKIVVKGPRWATSLADLLVMPCHVSSHLVIPCHPLSHIPLLAPGMLETTRIRKEGYAVRPTFGDFLHRYQALTYAWNLGQAANAGACRMLLQKAKLEDWQIGKSKVCKACQLPSG